MNNKDSNAFSIAPTFSQNGGLKHSGSKGLTKQEYVLTTLVSGALSGISHKIGEFSEAEIERLYNTCEMLAVKILGE
jgi:hypothetical protein